MPNPTKSTIHIDGPLSDIAIAYKQEGFIADTVFPIVPVDKQSDKFYIWDKDFWMRNAVERRTPGDTYPEGRMKISNSPFYCNLFHLGYGLPDEDLSNQDDAVQLEITGAEWLAQQFLLNRELSLVSDIFAVTKWETDVVGSTNFPLWSDYVNSDPVSDVLLGRQTIQKSTGQFANTLVVGQEVFDVLAEHPLLLDKFKYTQTGILEVEEVRRALRVPRLLVGASVYESTNEGDSTPTRGFIWGKNALLLHVPANPGIRVPAAGYTFVWRGNWGGGYTVAISTMRQDDRDRDFLKGKHAFDHCVCASDLGYFFSAAIS